MLSPAAKPPPFSPTMSPRWNSSSSTPSPSSSPEMSKAQKMQDEDVQAISNDEQDCSIIWFDPKAIDLLDCPICLEPLKPPISHCHNGHILCSSCCTHLKNICPICTTSIGSTRIRTLENLLESTKCFCPNKKFGCEETISYYDRNVHARTSCTYVPCTCPCCDHFVDSYKKLYVHLSDEHKGRAICFSYNEFLLVTLNNKVKNEIFVLQRGRGDVVFVLNNVVVDQHVGNGWNAVFVVCIGSRSLSDERLFKYTIAIVGDVEERFMIFQDRVKIERKNVDINNFGNITASTEYFLVPCSFFDSSGKLNISVKITEELEEDGVVTSY
ncbi:E3 ubiquitin-protein ligase SINA-like 10 [Senna tora]|uniref:RING-type E3 ubiquitin transferase n=1 Tax=Senna tora TaxID=362788 RepID=A0A834WW46_9FABA|nr:E3 ubiquitin-protein ligase SINA-like 10 [Senna tora]